jgi:4'-phosphopantetheinyl transferase
VYKLQGNKGVSFLEDMTILPFQYKPQGIMTLLLRKERKTQFFQVYYEKFQDYMLGYVVADEK